MIRAAGLAAGTGSVAGGVDDGGCWEAKNVLTGSRGRPSASSGLAAEGAQSRFWFVATVQPSEYVGHSVSDLTSDPNSNRTASSGAQIVDRLHLDTQVVGEFACGEYELQAQPGETFGVHNL
jgi:hypothetical protein